MVTSTAENFELSLRQGLTVLGLRARHRKKAERMMVGDRVLIYATGSDVFPATATIASTLFEDHAPIWANRESRPDDFPWRLRIQPNIVLDRNEYIDAHQIAPRLLYVKRWPPEQWPLAFQGQVHLLSAQDFRLIEHEMERMLELRRRRGHGRGRPGTPPVYQNRAAIQVEGPGRPRV
jgi:hypothetical protein